MRQVISRASVWVNIWSEKTHFNFRLGGIVPKLLEFLPRLAVATNPSQITASMVNLSPRAHTFNNWPVNGRG
jgi:hypothetical protein